MTFGGRGKVGRRDDEEAGNASAEISDPSEMTKRLFIALLGWAFLAQMANASAYCPAKFQVVGKCFVSHGSLAVSASMRPRIWRIGTKRIVEVFWQNGDQTGGLSPEIAAVFHQDIKATIYGDYTLCPISRDIPGVMQFVCMKSATHLFVVHSLKRGADKH